MSRNAFLRQLLALQHQPKESVHSVDLEAALKRNYMEVSRLSSYWEEIGAISHFSNRGGTGTTYRLTDKGLKLAKKMQTDYQRKKIGFIIISILIIAIATLLIF